MTCFWLRDACGDMNHVFSAVHSCECCCVTICAPDYGNGMHSAGRISSAWLQNIMLFTGLAMYADHIYLQQLQLFASCQAYA